METIEAKKQQMYKVKDDILIFLNNDVQIKFHKVFEWPESEGQRLGHINIWNDNAPFYILFSSMLQQQLRLKGFRKCYFIPNSFYRDYDKNKKMFLRCVDRGANCYLKFYPIVSNADKVIINNLIAEGHEIYVGLSNDKSHGEGFEIVTL